MAVPPNTFEEAFWEVEDLGGRVLDGAARVSCHLSLTSSSSSSDVPDLLVLCDVRVLLARTPWAVKPAQEVVGSDHSWPL